jgi:hypothetical protein
VVVIEDGRTNFFASSRSKAALAGGRQGRIERYAFDLLYFRGSDLSAAAQAQAAAERAVR